MGTVAQSPCFSRQFTGGEQLIFNIVPMVRNAILVVPVAATENDAVVAELNKADGHLETAALEMDNIAGLELTGL